jgi:hypothetical protein
MLKFYVHASLELHIVVVLTGLHTGDICQQSPTLTAFGQEPLVNIEGHVAYAALKTQEVHILLCRRAACPYTAYKGSSPD